MRKLRSYCSARFRQGEKEMKTSKLDVVKNSIVKVGDGRGFVIEHNGDRLVVTAAHCLPHLPPAHLGAYNNEKTYKNLLGRIGDRRSIWVECIFADSVSDVAVLGAPDSQSLYDEWEAYEKFTDPLKPIQIRKAKESETVWMLGLNGLFVSGVVTNINEIRVNVRTDGNVIRPGMSGSPLLGRDGSSVSLCAINDDLSQVNLPMCLPRWILERG